MRYRQNTKGDILYGPPVIEQLHIVLYDIKTIDKDWSFLVFSTKEYVNETLSR